MSLKEWYKIIGIPLGTVIITRRKVWGVNPLTKGVIIKGPLIGLKSCYLIQFECINHGVVDLWLEFGVDFKVVDP